MTFGPDEDDEGPAWLADLDDAGEITPAVAREIVATHGERGQRALEAVSEGRIKEYRDFTVVVGHTEEYVVEGGGCTCADATYNLDTDDPDQRCWHVLAAAIADRVGELDRHDMWYSEVRDFI